MAKWKKGESGNPKGKAKGTKHKAMSDKRLKEYLGKRTEGCIDAIMDMVTSEKSSGALKFKAANAIINFDFTIRALEYKKYLNKLKEDENKKKTPKTEEKSGKGEDIQTPLVSLVSVK